MLTLTVGLGIILGPALTFIVFNPKKSTTETIIDLIIVTAIQFMAVIYGVRILYENRPLYMAFEYDQFRIIYANETDNRIERNFPFANFLHLKTFSLKNIPKEERESLLFAELSGIPLATHPSLWQPYFLSKDYVIRASSQVSEIEIPQAKIDQILKKQGKAALKSDIGVIRLVGRNYTFGTLLIDLTNGEPIGMMSEDYAK